MIVTKLLESKLDIVDTNIIFCTNHNEMLLKLLRDKYNKRCFKSTFIINIERIVRRSNICCKGKVLDGTFYVDVLFEASCLVYEKGDIIQKCKIVEITDKKISAKSEFASLSVVNTTNIDIFKENEEIPVIVSLVRYMIFDTEVSISAVPLVPIPKDIVLFKLEEEKGGANDIVDNIIKDIVALKTRLGKCDKRVSKFFRELIYPYNTYKNYAKLYKCDKCAIKDISKLREGSIVFMGDKYLDEDIFYTCKSPKDIPDKEALTVPVADFAVRFLLDCKKNLTHLVEFAETYKELADIKASSHIWKMYNMLKK
jgi:hypothetical protein